jgi:hypothetical protein
MSRKLLYLSAGAENLFVAHICLCSLRGLPARVLQLIYVPCIVKRLALIYHEQIIDIIPYDSTYFAVFVLTSSCPSPHFQFLL